jgi:ferritin
MSPDLINSVSDIINSELTMCMVELNEMAVCHQKGLQGYKRFHRFNSMDRQRHAIMLTNFLVEYTHTCPTIIVQYVGQANGNGNGNASLVTCLQKMYDLSQAHLLKLKTVAALAATSGEDLLLGQLESMISDESGEAERYYREILELQNVNSDPVFTMIHSEKLHCKYKKKELKYFNYEV